MARGFLLATVLATLVWGGVSAWAADDGAAGKPAAAPQKGVMMPVELPAGMPRTADGWTDLPALLVPSDGSHSLGDENLAFNDKRDQGSKIVFVDPKGGDNGAAEVYWWDGKRIVDSKGNPANAAGDAYGTNPLQPNEGAIRAFKDLSGLQTDPRLRTHKTAWGAAGYPDWYLLRRGRVHDTFGDGLWGGRSQSEPMVVAAYGPPADGRAVVDAKGRSPFSQHNHGRHTAQFHQVLDGLELHQGLSHLGLHADCTSPGAPGVPTWLIEDCKIIRGQMNYLPIGTTVRRSISEFNWRVRGHNQGYFTSGFDAAPSFEEMIFYKNGYKDDPRTHADPRRTIFDRNIYQGGGAQMGHTYRNIISADGGSGGPQMRLGALCEDSLIIEGYWYSATSSNHPTNPWLVATQQTGRSAVVRDNVQFTFSYPSPNDPDTDDRSDNRAQPGWGYHMAGASFGALVEGNIVSGAMRLNDLGFAQPKGYAFQFSAPRPTYQDGKTYNLQRDVFRDNIGWRTATGLSLGGDWAGAAGQVAEGNVFVADGTIGDDRVQNLTSADQLVVRNNRFYSKGGSLPKAGWMGAGNTLAPYADAAKKENWPDPDRTLKRYVKEVLHLTLLDWSDDPYLDHDEVAKRVAAGEVYDPTGLKTFMAVATDMRRGGADPIPASGKPSWKGDYPWDARFNGVAVVNWVRAGFGLPPVGGEGD